MYVNPSIFLPSFCRDLCSSSSRPPALKDTHMRRLSFFYFSTQVLYKCPQVPSFSSLLFSRESVLKFLATRTIRYCYMVRCSAGGTPYNHTILKKKKLVSFKRGEHLTSVPLSAGTTRLDYCIVCTTTTILPKEKKIKPRFLPNRNFTPIAELGGGGGGRSRLDELRRSFSAKDASSAPQPGSRPAVKVRVVGWLMGLPGEDEGEVR